MDLPEIKRKPRKPSYIKPQSVKELERLADAEAKKLHPTCPAIAPRLFRDDTANALTKCITEYIRLKGGFASRINSTGVYNQKLRKYIPGTQKKGIADIISTYRGKSLQIEVKIGRDVQSDSQKKIQKEQEASGGLYFLAHNFTGFKFWFDELQ